eukprot:m.135943 g.135943  ORF g.135943 m.135943 type:complete len:265 (+) comp23931_c0_seq4:57-851(+)
MLLRPFTRFFSTLVHKMPHGGRMLEIKPPIESFGTFPTALKSQVEAWQAEGCSAAWLKVPLAAGSCLPAAGQQGFEFHHAQGEHAVLLKWLPQDKPSLVPPFATHQVGVAGLCVDGNNRILVIKERRNILNLWKLPGGLADPHESLAEAACREVYEETGVSCEPLSLTCFRHQTNATAFGINDLYFVFRVKPLSTAINICEHEIAAAKWMPLAEFASQSKHPMNTAAATSPPESDLLLTHLDSLVFKNRTFEFYHSQAIDLGQE